MDERQLLDLVTGEDAQCILGIHTDGSGHEGIGVMTSRTRRPMSSSNLMSRLVMMPQEYLALIDHGTPLTR